jgi:methanogenic corrinoid protein MtbC1
MSESTIKRWVDQGKIQANKSRGGHRRIALQEAIRFIRTSQTPVVHGEFLGFPELNTVLEDVPNRSLQEAGDVLFSYLVNGKAEHARGLLLYYYLRGHGVAALLDEPVRTAMAQAGTLWKHDDTGIYYEHQATQICIQAIHFMESLLPVGQSRFLALGGAPPGDPYMIPSLGASCVLKEEGLQTINFGPNLPFESLARAVEEFEPKLVWLSISAKPKPRDVAAGVDEICKRTAKIGGFTMMGGNFAPDIKPVEAKNLFVGATFAEMTAFVKGLNLGEGG